MNENNALEKIDTLIKQCNLESNQEINRFKDYYSIPASLSQGKIDATKDDIKDYIRDIKGPLTTTHIENTKTRHARSNTKDLPIRRRAYRHKNIDHI